MTRVEELTLRAVDGDLSDEETRELRDLVDADGEARQVHLSMLKVEGGLRSSLRKPGLTARVMERVLRKRKVRIVRGVMSQLRPRQAQQRRPAVYYAYAAAATILLVAGGTLLTRRATTDTAPVPAAPFASVAGSRGDVTVTRGQQRQPASAGFALSPGDRIEVAAGATAIIAYVGATRFLLGSETNLTLGGSEQVVHLDRGSVDAEVELRSAAEPLVFVTPHARAIVVGTRFTLAVTHATTRLDVAEGRVIFIRLGDGSTVEVGATQHALSDVPPPTATLAATPPRNDPDVRTILAFDFEDGEAAAQIVEGVLVPGPPRPDNRFALLGQADPHGGTRNSVKVHSLDPALFRYAGTQVISFDYWVDPDAKGILLQAWTPERDENLSYYVKKVARESWGYAEVRMADMVPQKNPARPMEEGAPMANIRVVGGRIVGKPLYVDNLKVVQYRPGAVLPTSSPGGYPP